MRERKAWRMELSRGDREAIYLENQGHRNVFASSTKPIST